MNSTSQKTIKVSLILLALNLFNKLYAQKTLSDSVIDVLKTSSPYPSSFFQGPPSLTYFSRPEKKLLIYYQVSTDSAKPKQRLIVQTDRLKLEGPTGIGLPSGGLEFTRFEDWNLDDCPDTTVYRYNSSRTGPLDAAMGDCLTDPRRGSIRLPSTSKDSLTYISTLRRFVTERYK